MDLDIDLLGLFNYWVFAALLMIGFYAVMAKLNLIKKLIGLSLFQSAVFLLYITMGRIEGGTAPIFSDAAGVSVYSNPLPHVLTLTAIVVQVATLGVSLALATAIYREYGSLDEDEVLKRIK